MNRKLIISKRENNILSLLFENDQCTQIDVCETESENLLGNIYIGRVQNIVTNINAAFIEIKKDLICYFSLEDNKYPVFLNKKNTDKVCIGDLLLVQVIKEPVKTKLPIVSCKINLPGELIALDNSLWGNICISSKFSNNYEAKEIKKKLQALTNDRFGFVVRTAAKEASEEQVLAEATHLANYYKNILNIAISRPAFTVMHKCEVPYINIIHQLKLTTDDQVITDIPDICDELFGASLKPEIRLYDDELLPLQKLYSFDKVLSEAVGKRVWLRSGGYLIIEYTEALNVIDVNTGKYSSKSRDKENTFLKINIEAAKEIARQLRLRNMSGIIIIDFINMEDPDNRVTLIETLKDLISNDPVKTAFVDITKLGLVELTRKKIKRPLYEVL